MPTLRDTISRRGSFMQALYALHQHPTFENLMEAYTLADMTNRAHIEEAVLETRILQKYDLDASCYTDEYLDLDEVHQTWLKTRNCGNLSSKIESVFPEMARLDDEVD